jgi:hypothetical protein
MNGDGADDALLVLARTEGGSGTFYYLGLALAEEGGYLGMNAAYLGDRISLPEVSVRNELATVRFREHAQDQPYAEEPTQEALVHGVFTGAVLEVVREVDGYHEGILTYEDEAWYFDVCNQTRVAVAEDSPSRAALEAIYLRESGAEGKGVFMSILAETGMDAAWRVTRILSVPAQGACTETSPRAPDAVPPEVSTTTEAY